MTRFTLDLEHSNIADRAKTRDNANYQLRLLIVLQTTIVLAENRVRPRLDIPSRSDSEPVIMAQPIQHRECDNLTFPLFLWN